METDRDTCEIQYREYRDGDENAIIDLFNFVFKRNFTVNKWHWAYKENPLNRQDIILAFCDGRLVGQSASTPLTFFHNGTPVKTTRIQNVMVHPDFQGRGIFTQTLKRLTDYIYRQQLDLVVTFPNNNSLPTFIRKLDYCHVDDIFTYRISGGDVHILRSTDMKIIIDESLYFKEADHDFIQRCLAGYAYFNSRDLPYLIWRFNTKSGKGYRVLRAFRDDRLTAIVIFKYYPDARGVDLVEFFTNSGTDNILEILKTIMDYYLEHSVTVDSFSIWLLPHYRIYQPFIEAGFTKTTFSTHVVSKSFSPATADGFDLSTSYYLAMGDSDVY